MSSHDSDPRPLLLGGPALGLRLIVLAGMAAGLMVADQRDHHLAAIRDGVATLAYPIQWAVSAPVQAFDSMRESFATRTRVEAENVKLASDNLVLRLKLLRFDSLEQENQRLRAARESSARAVQRTLIAEILRVDLDPIRQRVLVNKGTQAGVFRGQAVIDANGIFGQVTRAGPYSAEIILITDPESAIPLQVNRTGVRGIAYGTGKSGLLSLPFLPQNTDVIVGDLLVSSGLGGVYPPGYPVAKVISVVRDPGQPLLAVEAEPLAGLDRVPEVLLVWFDNAILEPEPVAEAETKPAATAPAATPRSAPPASQPAPQQAAPAQAQTQAPAATPTDTPAPPAQEGATPAAAPPADTPAPPPGETP